MTPLMLSSVHYNALRSPSDRAAIRNQLAQGMEAFERTHPVHQAQSFEQKPRPARSSKIDPETRLRRSSETKPPAPVVTRRITSEARLTVEDAILQQLLLGPQSKIDLRAALNPLLVQIATESAELPEDLLGCSLKTLRYLNKIEFTGSGWRMI